MSSLNPQPSEPERLVFPISSAVSPSASPPSLETAEMEALTQHFELGTIESTRILARGSTEHPKTVIQTSEGEFLLKRRVDDSADSELRVQEVQRLHQRLLEVGFPLPALVADPVTKSTMLKRAEVSYELTHFIHGTTFDRTAGAAHAAGSMLARFHQATAAIRPPAASIPLARPFHQQLEAISALATAAGQILERQNPAERQLEIQSLVSGLLEYYLGAADRVDGYGFAGWPRNIVHGDWHPGNLLFHPPNAITGNQRTGAHGGAIAAVLDLDSMRYEPRSADVANGCLQFSMQAQGLNPQDWLDAPDEDRLLAFCDGYDEFDQAVILSTPEIQALPSLMIEALIAESLAPIAATGLFLTIPGLPFLQMIQRKVGWIEKYNARICKLLNG